jgi:hypothetical protein
MSVLCSNQAFFSPSELGLSFESTPVLNSELLLEDAAASLQAESKEEGAKTMALVNSNLDESSQASVSRWGEVPLG